MAVILGMGAVGLTAGVVGLLKVSIAATFFWPHVFNIIIAIYWTPFEPYFRVSTY